MFATEDLAHHKIVHTENLSTSELFQSSSTQPYVLNEQPLFMNDESIIFEKFLDNYLTEDEKKCILNESKTFLSENIECLKEVSDLYILFDLN